MLLQQGMRQKDIAAAINVSHSNVLCLYKFTWVQDEKVDVEVGNLAYSKKNSSSRFLTKYKTKSDDLSSQHSIKPYLRKPTRV